MAALRKYPDELRERAIRLVLDARAEPGNSGKGACRRIGGKHSEFPSGGLCPRGVWAAQDARRRHRWVGQPPATPGTARDLLT